jgi:LuxR family transcriptional regulator
MEFGKEENHDACEGAALPASAACLPVALPASLRAGTRAKRCPAVATGIPHFLSSGEEAGSLASSIQDWLDSLRAFDLKALVILGPGSADDLDRRQVWAAHPATYRPPAEAFAASDAYGSPWRASNSPAMAWQNVKSESGEGGGWRRCLADHGILAVVRSDVAMPFGAGYECIAFGGRHLNERAEALEIGWALNNVWPLLKTGLIASRFGLTTRAREVLRILAAGRTAKETADIVGLKERTVHFHLATVMERLKAENRAAAVLRACMLGIL